jgi:hypothetical protein
MRLYVKGGENQGYIPRWVRKLKTLIAILMVGFLMMSIVAPHRHRQQIPSQNDDTIDNIVNLPEMLIQVEHKRVVETLVLSPLLTSEETNLVKLAANKWETATNGIVSFKFPEQFRFQIIEEGVKDDINYKAITVRPADEEDEAVSAVDRIFQKGTVVVGYYDADNFQHTALHDLFVIPDRISTSSEELRVFTHELGHSIGMQHTDDTASVMQSDISLASDDITEQDLQQFCALYTNCKNPEFLFPGTTQEEAPECVVSDYTQTN